MAERQGNSKRRTGMHQTTLRFGPTLWAELEEAAQHYRDQHRPVRARGRGRAARLHRRARGRSAAGTGAEVAREATSYDELQAQIGDLASSNVRGRERASELDRLNLFLENILGGLGVAVVVLDPDGRVQAWNDAAEEAFGLPADRARDRLLTSLDLGIPAHAVERVVENALAVDAREGVDSADLSGRRVVVRALPLASHEGTRNGAVLLIGEPTLSADPEARSLPRA